MTVDQLETAHWFADRCEKVMTEFLKRLLDAVRTGTFDVKHKLAGTSAATTLRVLEKLGQLPHSKE